MRWIKCSDQMPAHDTIALLYVNPELYCSEFMIMGLLKHGKWRTKQVKGKRIKYQDPDYWEPAGYSYSSLKLEDYIYWMPLPAPPYGWKDGRKWIEDEL